MRFDIFAIMQMKKIQSSTSSTETLIKRMDMSRPHWVEQSLPLIIPRPLVWLYLCWSFERAFSLYLRRIGGCRYHFMAMQQSGRSRNDAQLIPRFFLIYCSGVYLCVSSQMHGQYKEASFSSQSGRRGSGNLYFKYV